MISLKEQILLKRAQRLNVTWEKKRHYISATFCDWKIPLLSLLFIWSSNLGHCPPPIPQLMRTPARCISFFFLIFIYLFIYFWLCWVFVSVRGLSLVAASGGHSSSQCAGLTVAASLVAEHRLQMRRLSSCGSRAQLLRGMWDLPRPGLEPVSPALAGRFSTTAPLGKPKHGIFVFKIGLQRKQIPYGKRMIWKISDPVPRPSLWKTLGTNS